MLVILTCTYNQDYLDLTEGKICSNNMHFNNTNHFQITGIHFMPEDILILRVFDEIRSEMENHRYTHVYALMQTPLG